MPAAPMSPPAPPGAEERSYHGPPPLAAAAAPTATAADPRNDDNNNNPFAAVDVAEDEPHPEGTVERAAAAAAAAAGSPADVVCASGDGPPTTTRRPAAAAAAARARARAAAYFCKMRGGLDHPPPVPRAADLLWSFVGAFCAILAVSGLDAALWGLPPAARSYGVSGASLTAGGNDSNNDNNSHSPNPSLHPPLGALPVLVASFGASAVLLFGAPESKLSQPRGCVGGHVLSAAVGVLARLALGEAAARAPAYVVAALGMALALTAMQLTQTTHPPGGATALIACTAPGIPTPEAWFGARFVLAVAVGSVVVTASAALVNNLAADRAYPTYWWWGTRGPPRWMMTVAGKRAAAAGGGGKAGAAAAGGPAAAVANGAAATPGAPVPRPSP